MAQTAKLGVQIDAGEGVAQLTQLQKLLESIGVKATESFAKAESASRTSGEKIVSHAKRTEEERTKLAEKTASDIKAAEDRLNAAREKGIDHVRQQIFEFEETKRKLALESAHTLDEIRQKEIKEETKKINAELQLYRSLEKEQKGRTFTEQLEKAPKHEGKHGGGLSMVGEVTGIAVAVEGLETLVEKSKEVAEAQHQLQIGTGLSGEALEEAGKKASEIGDKLGVSGDDAKKAMGKIASYTHATGEELAKQTEAVIAYAAAHGKSAERVAKQLDSAEGRNKIFAESVGNIARAQQAAQQPALQAELLQKKFMETVGELANTLLVALGPVLKSISPLITQVGEVLGSVLKPILGSLAPVVTKLATVFTDLAPVITDLVQNALGLLTPILTVLTDLLSSIMPVITDVAKTVITALSPVFKQLTPVIEEVTEIFKELFTAQIMGIFVPILKDVFVPIIRDLVAPILVSLMPILKLIADIAMKTLVPAIQLISGVMKFLIDNGVAPLVKWLSGGLVQAINAVVGVAEKVIGAISKIASVVGDLLGLGGDAPKKAVQKQTAEVVQATQQGIQEVDRVKEKEDAKEEKRQQQLAKRGAGAAAKAVKDAYAEAKAAEDNAHAQRMNELTQQLLDGKLTEEDFNEQKEADTISHLDRVRKLDEQYKKSNLASEQAYLNALLAQQKRVQKEREDTKKKEADDDKKNRELLEAQAQKDADQQIAQDKEIEKRKLDLMKEGIDKMLALENARYKEEQEKAKGNAVLLEQLELEHTQKLQGIRNQQANEILSKESQVTDLLSKNKAERFSTAKGYILEELKQFVASKIAEVAITDTSESSKTGATLAGIAARAGAVAAEIGQNLLSAASSAFSAVAGVIKWIFGTFPFPLSVAIAGAGIASVYGLYKGARSLFKFAEGGIVDKPTNFTFGDGQQGQAGEAGKEAIIPLHKLPEVINSVLPRNALGSTAVNQQGEVVSILRDIHAATMHTAQYAANPKLVTAIDGYKQDLSIRTAQLQVQQAKL